MPVCSSCGAQNNAGARFCERCGTPMGHACANCGESLSPSARFCPSCGTTVAEATRGAEERKIVTVLFADVVGSTGLGELLDPERVKEVMSSYFTAMREEIESQGGTVEKFIGDAIMAVFGVPQAHEDDRARALRAALRMRRRLEDLNRSLLESAGVQLAMRVGINTGEVVVTPDPKPGEGMVAGDAVNAAARLEQLAEPGTVIVGERTARGLRGFDFRQLGDLALRGKTHTVEAVELLDERAAEQRGVPGLRAPMIGRDRELDLLETLLERSSAEQRPQLVTVYGEAGVGKSRLLSEFIAGLTARDALVVRGRCLPYGEGVTYWPVAEILKTYASVQDDEGPSAALEKIMSASVGLLTGVGAADAERSAAALAFTVGIEHPDFDFRSMPPRHVATEIHQAWQLFFSALAVRQPVVAVVEDVHWADTALLDLLGDLAYRCRAALLILCTARPELTARHPEWGAGKRNFSSIVLDPLSSADSGRLMESLLQVADLPLSLRERILERAEGNPFFLEEILRQLIDSGKLERTGTRWHAAAGIDDVQIPDTVQEVLAARIDLLKPPDKRTLQLAAVVGRIFWTAPLQQLLNGEASQLDDILDRLQDRELVLARMGSSMSGQREYIFKHILTRDVAYTSLPRRERGAAHATVATWIEQVSGERRLEMVELLAYHYSEAYRLALERDPRGAEPLRRRAYDTLLAASTDARTKTAFHKALRWAEQAVDISSGDEERAIALEMMGAAAHELALGDEAWRCFTEAAEARLRLDDSSPQGRIALAFACARACDMRTRWPGVMLRPPAEDAVARYLEVGLRSAGDGDSEAKTLLLVTRAFWGWAFEITGDAPVTEADSQAAAEEAVQMALRLEKPDLASAALDALGAKYSRELRASDQLAACERRIALIDRIRDLQEVGDIYAMYSWALRDLGRYRAARDAAEEGYRRTLEDLHPVAGHCVSWRLLAEYRLGLFDDALASYELMRSMMEDRADTPPPYSWPAHLAALLILYVRGHTEAVARTQQALEKTLAGLPRSRNNSTSAMALYHAYKGDAVQAWDWLGDERWDSPPRSIAKYEIVLTTIYLLEQWDRAKSVLQVIRERTRGCGARGMEAMADRLEGAAALAAGDQERALHLLSRARSEFNKLEAPWERANTDLSLALAFRDAGDEERALGHLNDARGVFESLHSLPDLQRVQDLLAGSSS